MNSGRGCHCHMCAGRNSFTGIFMTWLRFKGCRRNRNLEGMRNIFVGRISFAFHGGDVEVCHVKPLHV
jgi:hypothetical protein